MDFGQWRADSGRLALARGYTRDSLGEAGLDEGDKPDSITKYRKSLAISPANRNAVSMLRKLRTK